MYRRVRWAFMLPRKNRQTNRASHTRGRDATVPPSTSVQPLPDGDGEILGRRNQPQRIRELLCSESDGPWHQALRCCMISFNCFRSTTKPELGSTSPFTVTSKRVIVPVAIRVIALAENARVFFRREIRIVIVVRCGKFGFASQIDHRSITSFHDLLSMRDRNSGGSAVHRTVHTALPVKLAVRISALRPH